MYHTFPRPLETMISAITIVPRPLETTTQEFGKKWGSFSYEKKLKLQCSIKKPSEFMDLVKKRFNFHPIEIIGE